MTSHAVQRTAACDGNLAFIREERRRVRELSLSTAARAGKLNEQGAQLADFVEGQGRCIRSRIGCAGSDEQDEDEEA